MRRFAIRPSMKNRVHGMIVVAGFFVLSVSAVAQGTYALTWSSTTHGGGRTTGGQYAIVGAVGDYTSVRVCTGAEAPTPNPMQWAVAPYAASSSSISMTAAEAGDANGAALYYFQNVTVASGSHDSEWQVSRTYTDNGLTADTLYQYRVKAKGGGGTGNETAYSAPMFARTEAEPGATPEGSAKPVSGELGSDLNLQVDPFTGSVNYTLPIAVPPGRQGSEPSIALRYGGGGNGWCGVGWSLGMGAIQRDTKKGVPVARSGGTYQNKYDDSKGFIAGFGAVTTRLVLIGTQNGVSEYRAETDQAFLKYELHHQSNWWVVTDKSGNKFYFGYVAGEGQDPDHEYAGTAMVHPTFDTGSGSDSTFMWALGKIEDINGNLTYIYYQGNSGQKYLKEIWYNGHTAGLPTTSSVQFTSDDGRPDKSVSYATGARVENNLRLSDIKVRVYDYETEDWTQVRRYHLNYTTSSSTLRSLLTSVTLCGASDANSLPPIAFEYQQKPFEFESTIDWGPLDSQSTTPTRNSPMATNVSSLSRRIDYPDTSSSWVNVAYSYDKTQVALCDLNGDGLPDRVLRNTGGFASPNNVLKTQFNTGLGFRSLQNWGSLDAQGHTTDGEAELWNSPRASWTDIFTAYFQEANQWVDGYLDTYYVPGHWEEVFIEGHTEYLWVPEHSQYEYVWIPPHYESQYINGHWVDEWVPGHYTVDITFHCDQADETPVDILDINGDGLPDRVTRISGNDFSSPNRNIFKVQLNTGSGFASASNWGPLYAFGHTTCNIDDWNWDMKAKAFNSVGASYGGSLQPTLVCFADMNHDGLPDRILYQGGGTGDFKVQFNTGSGFENTSGTPVVTSWGPVSGQGSTAWEWLAPRTVDSGEETMIDLVDINGDGLPDRVMRKMSSPFNCFVVQFNTGYGFETDTSGNPVLRNWEPVSGQGDPNTAWNSLQGVIKESGTFYVDLFDINGDGLPDRVMREITPSQGGNSTKYDVFKVQLNTGTGFQKEGDGSAVLATWTGVDDQGTSQADWGSPYGVYRAPDEDSVTYVTMCDINGDGLPDRVMRKVNADYTVFKVQLNKGPFPELLCKVTGKLGGFAEVTYKSSADPNAHKDNNGISRLPFPVHVASLVRIDDGFGNQVLTQYDYSRGFYNAVRREFAGFGLVTIKEVKEGQSGLEQAGTTTLMYFHQGGGYQDTSSGEWQDAGSVGKRGRPYRVEAYGNDGKLYTITTNKVNEVEVSAGTGWHFAYVAQTTTLEYPGIIYTPGSHLYPWDFYRAKIQRVEYNTANGNLTKSLDLGEVDLGITTADIAAHLANHTYETSSGWGVGDELYTHRTYATISGHPEILNRIADIKTTSDEAGSNKLKETTFAYDSHGRVTDANAWLDKTAAGPINQGAGQYIAVSHLSYDTYGNCTSSTDAAGIQTTTTFDSSYNMFPVESTTGSFITSIDYDPRSGLPLRSIDPAGMVAENVYDDFFRLTDCLASTEPDGQADLWLTHIDYNLGGISSGASQNYIHQVHEGYEAYTYSDGIGRVIQTRVKAETGAPGQYRVAATSYNEIGKLKLQTLPFFSSGSSYTSSAGQPGTLTEYEAIGRVWRVTPPTGETGSPTGYSTTLYGPGAGGDPWEVVSTDPEDKSTWKYFDAAGRVVEVDDEYGTTTYEYDRLGRLITTADNSDNEITAEYDSLDGKIRSVDPDMGTWTYTYDNAGRMTEQVDARGNKVQLAYETNNLGRLSQKTVKNSANTVVETITYTYDQSDDPAYRVHKGQIYEATDGQGWTKSGYDSRGRPIKSTRYITAAGKSYTTQTEYDSADRVTYLTYPDDKAVVAYIYDEAGHLTTAQSLWGTGANVTFYQASGFNAAGQMTQVAYGNGRTTQYQYYSSTQRLKRIVTLGDPNIQDISYTFDTVANVKSVTDAVHTGTQSCSLSSITYDDLHRLVSLYSSAESRTLTYEYDALGNIHKNGEMGTGTYTYSTRPHAVLSANGSSYAYDACGNMTTRNRSGQPSQTLTYDEQNRLTQVAVTGGNTMTFGYAEGGARLWKKVNGTVTDLWIGNLYEEKDGKILCHVYAGARLVATFEPESSFACLIQRDPYLAAIWTGGGKALMSLFGSSRTPLTLIALAVVAGLCIGRRTENRRWRRVVLTVLTGTILITSVPMEAYAGTPVYDPVFYYYHPDHLGSSQLMTDRDGDVIQQYGYSPFGREDYKNNTQAFSISNRYTSQILDEDTGLYYYGARYYDPELARFIQADSMVPGAGTSQALNRYSYCFNNPLKLTDPSGHDPYDGFSCDTTFSDWDMSWTNMTADLPGDPMGATGSSCPIWISGNSSTGLYPVMGNPSGLTPGGILDPWEDIYSSGDPWAGLAKSYSARFRGGYNGWNALTSQSGLWGGYGGDVLTYWWSDLTAPVDYYRSFRQSGLNPPWAFAESGAMSIGKIVGASDASEAIVGVDVRSMTELSTSERAWRGAGAGVQMASFGFAFSGSLSAGAGRGVTAAEVDNIVLHHPISKFLGGDADQVLTGMDESLHIEFHSALRANLKNAGIPLNVGGRGGSTFDWWRYMQNSPGTQRQAFDAVLDASRYMDVRYGTSMTQDVWQNIMNRSFEAHP